MLWRQIATITAITLALDIFVVAEVDAQPFFGPRDLQPTGPKTLLAWQNAESEEEEGEPDVVERIITDRPHIAEAASLVGLGRVQVETGYTFFLDHSGGSQVQTHSFPEPLFRIGLFREWFEFRLQYNYLIESTTGAAGSGLRRGSDDLYVGAKIALAEQSGMLPEFTIFPQMRVPVGHQAYSANAVLPGMNFAYAWMVTDKLEIEANTQVNKRRDDGIDHFYTEILQTVNFEYDLHEKVMVFNEFVLFSPVGAELANVEWYIHPGLHYFIMPNLQVDFHAGLGLNAAADDFFGGSGLSWRW
ncbi:MAG: transporter [Planctomycetaceae bacterium]|nr:transporter [Planctomycetaceae bacterium]